MSEAAHEAQESMEERPAAEPEHCPHYQRRAPPEAELEAAAAEPPLDFQKEVQLLEAGLQHPLVLPEPEVR